MCCNKWFVPVLVGAAIVMFSRFLFGGAAIEPAEALARVEAGSAVVVDVREPSEWEGGVVEGALLLPLSDLRGGRNVWAAALEEHGGKEFILYCRSGRRSGIAAGILGGEGIEATNGGGYGAWTRAGVPVAKPGATD
jgi:rhodanese-related sulfurtransferase